MIGLLASPELIEPLIILAGGGLDSAARVRGAARVRRWVGDTLTSYFERIRHAGLVDYRDESRLTRYVPEAARSQ
jgi:hypothetical protein